MDFSIRPKMKELLDRVAAMVRDEIAPLEAEYHAEVGKGDRWEYTDRQAEILEGLKARAKEAGLWNFWLTDSERGFGLTTVEYAHFAEEMGKTPMGAEVFNCNAPDTGNMEVFERYGTPDMKERWLAPLLAGDIRSAYLMTEPQVASSDATNLEMSCVRDGDDYVINGRKMVGHRRGRSALQGLHRHGQNRRRRPAQAPTPLDDRGARRRARHRETAPNAGLRP